MRYLILFVGFLLSLTACSQIKNSTYHLMLRGLLSHTVNEVSVEDLSKKEDIILLDAREKEEFEVSHIENAIWVGYNDFDIKRVENLPKDKEVVVYCSVGYRSEKVAEKLEEAGFENVANLYGGIFEWKNKEQNVVNEEGVTEEVHAFDKKWGIWLENGKKIY